jgi:hypothetical protein
MDDPLIHGRAFSLGTILGGRGDQRRRLLLELPSARIIGGRVKGNFQFRREKAPQKHRSRLSAWSCELRQHGAEQHPPPCDQVALMGGTETATHRIYRVLLTLFPVPLIAKL